MATNTHNIEKTRAIVSHGLYSEGGWKMEDVVLRQPGDKELVVEVIAAGICHTDRFFGDQRDAAGMIYPAIKGHEGSGYVRAVGKAVTVAAVGDPVLLSYNCCHECSACADHHYSYCLKFFEKNVVGSQDFRLASSDKKEMDIHANFFGQSSFAQHTLVSDASVVNVKGIVESREDLQLFAPLGCGIQTGAGTVINVAKPGSDDSIAILGLGGVGLSAIMAAKLTGARQIIGIDRVEKRLELAKKLGATHVVNTSTLPEGTDLVKAVKDIADGAGPHSVIETTGALAVVKQAMEFTRQRGTLIQLGSATLDLDISFNLFLFMVSGKIFRGAIEGEAVPKEFVPRLIRWHREGRFPFDQLVQYFKAEEFDKAMEGMHKGDVIKPILLW